MRTPLLIILMLTACKSSAPTPPSPVPTTALPTRDDACLRDDDCDYDWMMLVDGKCCDGTCSPAPASKRHLEAVAVTCKALGSAADCPTKKCAAPPPLACEAGRCTFKD